MVSYSLPVPLRALTRRLIDAVLPPRCIACGVTVDRQGGVCGDCFNELTFITEPMCARCGLPFALDGQAGQVCGGCLADPPKLSIHRAALRYDAGGRRMVLAFKHGDRTDMAPTLAGWMAQAGRSLLDRDCWLAPVPLHRNRLWRRRYNQSALLALGIGRLAAARVIPDLLVRTRATPSQGGLTRDGRSRNVAGAFALSPDHEVTDRRIVLIDDVYTTGATMNACAAPLLRAGAREVAGLSLARVGLD